MKEGIENLPDEAKLVYEIGIENDDRLKRFKRNTR